MTSYISRSLLAANSAGLPLSAKLNIRADEDLSDRTLFLIEELEKTLMMNGFFSTSFDVGSIHSKGSVEVCEQRPQTRTYEEAHKLMHSVWKTPNRSFSKGWAYALIDYKHADESEIITRRSMALGLCNFHAYASQRYREGQFTENDHDQLNAMVDVSGSTYSYANWPAFLRVVENLRYYPFFIDTLEKKATIEAAEKEILTASEMAKKESVLHGLVYLAQFADFRPVIMAPNGECIMQSGSGTTLSLVNDVSVWEHGVLDEDSHVLTVMGGNGSLNIKLWTRDNNIARIVSTLLEKSTSDLERSFGRLTQVYNGDMQRYFDGVPGTN